MRVSSILATVAALGAATVLSVTPATGAGSDVLVIPDDIVGSDTRATGHYEVVDGGALRVYTEGNTSTDKVALYFDGGDQALGEVGEPALDQTPTEGTIPPGFQLGVDFDGDGTDDGFLVGEPSYYGTDWWLSTGSPQFVKDGAPNTGGGFGSPWYGTLAEWAAAFPEANVGTFGFSLGSGVYGDWVIDSISYADTTYTFAEGVTLSGKDDCKNGGWATSTDPEFKNQGDCVSYFATQRG